MQNKMTDKIFITELKRDFVKYKLIGIRNQGNNFS